MADKESQKKGALRPSSLIGGEGKKPSAAAGLAQKLFAVETQAVKSYGVYNSDDYAGWRKKNGFGNINSESISKQASNLQSRLKSENISMADIKAANAFIKKYHSPLVGLDKREAKKFNEQFAKAKRRLPFHRTSSLINVASNRARAERKQEDQ